MEQSSCTTGGEHHVVRMNCVGDAGVRVIGDHARNGAPRLVKHHIGHVPFLGEFDAGRDALLPQRVQDLMADAVRRICRPAHGHLAEIRGVTTEPSLRDVAVIGAGERHAHTLQVDHGLRGVLGEQLGRILIDQPVAALDGVVVMPMPIVLFHIAQTRRDAALR